MKEELKKKKREKELLDAKNSFGDDMTQFLWDGPSDSDEEIPELVPLRNE